MKIQYALISLSLSLVVKRTKMEGIELQSMFELIDDIESEEKVMKTSSFATVADEKEVFQPEIKL